MIEEKEGNGENKMTKGRYVIRIIAGGYLAYLGSQMIQYDRVDPPNYYVLLNVLSVFFIIVGVAFIFFGLRAIYRINQEERKSKEDSVPEPEPVQEVKQKKSMLERAQMANTVGDEPSAEEMVTINSEDIIAATEEIIETSENENTIASIDIDLESELENESDGPQIL